MINKQTIILHGTGRSGTSMLNNILVNHPDVAWISNYQVYALAFPMISFLNRFVTHSVDLNSNERSHLHVHSSNEPYAMWKKFFPNFNDLDGVPRGEKYSLENYTRKICRYAGKKIFITKITGNSRAEFINHAFSNYKVVWIDRNPIAVVNSMMKQRWFFKNKPEEFEAMSKQGKIEFYCKYYKEIVETKWEIPEENLILVQYEDLVKNPILFFDKLTAQLDITFPNEFAKKIKDWNIKPVPSEYYRKLYSEEEWELLNNLLKNKPCYND